MNKCYYRIFWKNHPDDSTPLNDVDLNRGDVAIDEIDNRVIYLDSSKFDKSEAQLLIKDMEIDIETGILTKYYYNGSIEEINTGISKLNMNLRFDAEDQMLYIVNADGTEDPVDLSVFITNYEFEDSDTIAHNISGGKVKSIVKEGSIQEKHLQPNYLADIKVESAKAESSATAAATSEANSKASENAAKASENASKESEENAASYATSASESADTATQKASAAAESEENSAISKESAAESAGIATAKANIATEKANIATQGADTATEKATEASDYATEAESYARGGTGTRENEEIDNSKYYYEQLKNMSQSKNGLIPKGTITFEELSDADNQVEGYFFNISDSFVSDERFVDGGGIFYGAGNNVLYTADGMWDVTAASMVSGVKGDNETEYRQGFVNFTAENIGAFPGVTILRAVNIDELYDSGFYFTINCTSNSEAFGDSWLMVMRSSNISNIVAGAAIKQIRFEYKSNASHHANYEVTMRTLLTTGWTEFKRFAMYDEIIPKSSTAGQWVENTSVKNAGSESQPVYFKDGVPTPVDNALLQANKKDGHWGIVLPDGNNETRIRTTKQGILPYESKDSGIGSIGIKAWPFAEVHGKKLFGSVQVEEWTSSKWPTFDDLPHGMYWVPGSMISDFSTGLQAKIGKTGTYILKFAYLPSEQYMLALNPNTGRMLFTNKYGSTAAWSDWFEFDVPVMTGATADSSGAAGLVPKPSTASKDKYLRGNGTWDIPNPNAAIIQIGTEYNALHFPDGTRNGWLEMPINGILPYMENEPNGNGHGFIGTEGWCFLAMYANNFYASKNFNGVLNGDILGIYSGDGGRQPPSFITSGHVKFAMMNGFNGLIQPGYMDCMLMDTYYGTDVPWVTAFAITKQETPRAFIVTGSKGETTDWHTYRELFTTAGGTLLGTLNVNASVVIDDSSHGLYLLANRIESLYSAGLNGIGLSIDGAYTNLMSETIYLQIFSTYAQFRPSTNGKCALGGSNYRWGQIFSATSTIATSDRRLKKDISELPNELTKKFILGLVACMYQMIDGQSGRYHYGFIAQDIEELMNRLGMDSKDFAGFIKSPKTREVEVETEIEVDEEYVDEDGEIKTRKVKKTEKQINQEVIPGEYIYSLRYEEFIAPIVKVVQMLAKENEEQKNEIEKLKETVEKQQEEISTMKEENRKMKERMERIEDALKLYGILPDYSFE